MQFFQCIVLNLIIPRKTVYCLAVTVSRAYAHNYHASLFITTNFQFLLAPNGRLVLSSLIIFHFLNSFYFNAL